MPNADNAFVGVEYVCMALGGKVKVGLGFASCMLLWGPRYLLYFLPSGGDNTKTPIVLWARIFTYR